MLDINKGRLCLKNHMSLVDKKLISYIGRGYDDGRKDGSLDVLLNTFHADPLYVDEDTGQNALFIAIFKNYPRSFALMLEYIDDVDSLSSLQDPSTGDTLLIRAVNLDRSDIFVMLIWKSAARDPGIDVNIQNFSGNTALHYATINNRPRMVEMLLKNGARNIENNVYQTPSDMITGEAVRRVYNKFAMNLLGQHRYQSGRQLPPDLLNVVGSYL